MHWALKTMILKAIALKIASWFTSEAKAVEADAVAEAKSLGADLSARISQIESQVHMNASAIAAETAARLSAGSPLAGEIVSGAASDSRLMTQTGSGGRTYLAGFNVGVNSALAAPIAIVSTPSNGVSMDNINTAIQIAVALKTIDASLTADQVRAATTAALAALYPAPAPTA
ncbi:hypothetical protein F4827_005061 [Paraburkholderia bannensis]|uniref:Uncharacterized protein n=1 Tax=Paraburkholderia bannensis TaxID=765414 RepID=A0A7W9WTC6_9BURK|nr:MULTISPECIES: hypothetical protein [Paraburkholderia]MBB3259989.1 hypothetical protein [Paraburkholderia sp. WP4_3_2]MBB6105195.1 hypothetical protein [Paraburkholderia bannensis]